MGTEHPRPVAGADPDEAEPVGERRPGVIHGLGNIIENAVDFAQTRVDIDVEWDEETEKFVMTTIANHRVKHPTTWTQTAVFWFRMLGPSFRFERKAPQIMTEKCI